MVSHKPDVSLQYEQMRSIHYVVLVSVPSIDHPNPELSVHKEGNVLGWLYMERYTRDTKHTTADLVYSAATVKSLRWRMYEEYDQIDVSISIDEVSQA